MSLAPLELDAAGLCLRGLRQAVAGAPRVLALHGWLDNAASFLPLLPHLPPLDLALLDLPGHGHSDHLPPGVPYTGASAILQVLAAADALGWDDFIVLGHSLGAGIASQLAAAAPERVRALVAIEGLGGLAGADADTASRLREAITAFRRAQHTPLRVFPDREAAVRARMRINALSHANATLLVERGVRAVPGGFQWRSDPRLTLPTPVRMGEGQVQDLLRHIGCPTLIVFADPAPAYFPDALRLQRAALVPAARLVRLPGPHHLHMEDPQGVGAAIGAFVRDLPTAD